MGEMACPEGLNMPLRRTAAADELAIHVSGKDLLGGGEGKGGGEA